MLKVRIQNSIHNGAFGAFSWRRMEPNPDAARDILSVITKITSRSYPYHTLFAYDEINKAAKRHGT